MNAGKSIRILFDEQIFSNQKFGGISRYYSELVKSLAVTENVTAKILSPMCTNHYAKNLPQRLRVGIPFPSLAGSETFRWHFNRKFSDYYIRHFKPDVLHQTYYPIGNPRPHPGSQIVTTVHDMIHELFPENFRDAKQVTAQKLQAVKNADLVICVSENTQKDLIKITGIEVDKTTVIHHGVNHFGRTRLPAARPHQKPYLLYVGLRHSYKNFQRVLKGYAKSLDLVSAFDLVCFGGGPLTESEKKLISQLNIPDAKIVMTSGNDAVLCSLYQHAKAFLYPSVYEGFGLPPLEAMLQGCPVISSNVSSLPEVLGNAVEYFDPNDTDDLVDSVTRVVFNPRRANELTHAGLDHVQRFTWQRCAEQTLCAYRAIAKD